MGQTFQEYLRSKLAENGMFDDMIDKIMPLIIQDKRMSLMAGRWTSQVEGYPPNMAVMVFMNAKPVVHAWLAQHAPGAWFRPMFAPGVENCSTNEESEKFVNDFWAKAHAEEQSPIVAAAKEALAINEFVEYPNERE